MDFVRPCHYKPLFDQHIQLPQLGKVSIITVEGQLNVHNHVKGSGSDLLVQPNTMAIANPQVRPNVP